MGNVLRFPYGVSGATLYARLTNDAGQSWYTTTPALEGYSSAHFAAYAVLLAEEGSSGDYTLTVPAALPAGRYTALVRLRAGGSAVEDPATDTPVGVIGLPDFVWSGSALSELTATERNTLADALLVRDWTAVTGATTAPRHSVLNALRFSPVNKWAVDPTTGELVVYLEDSTSEAYRAAPTTDLSAGLTTAQTPV